MYLCQKRQEEHEFKQVTTVPILIPLSETLPLLSDGKDSHPTRPEYPSSDLLTEINASYLYRSSTIQGRSDGLLKQVSSAMTALESSLFSLGPLPDLDSRPFTDIELDALLPTHQLPRLDEYAPGAERLLKGLDSSYYGFQNVSPTRKGKEREISPEAEELSPGEVKALELDWAGLGAATDRDGAHVFEVSGLRPIHNKPDEKPLRWWDARDGARETAAQMMSEQPPLFDALSIR